MKKKIISLLLTAALCLSLIIPASAADGPLFWDDAYLLSDSECDTLLRQLEDIRTRQDMDVVIVTVDTLDGVDVQDAADYIYDYYDYGVGEEKDGVLLLLSMEEREWAVSTTGFGRTVLDDHLDEVMDNIMGDLGSGDYASAFSSFAAQCDALADQFPRETVPQSQEDDWVSLEEFSGDTGSEDSYILFPRSFDIVTSLLTSFGLSIAVAFLITTNMKHKLQTVTKQESAGNYLNAGLRHMDEGSDTYLHRSMAVMPVAEKKSSSQSGTSISHSSGHVHFGGGGFSGGSHFSGGGHSHGGGHGHF